MRARLLCLCAVLSVGLLASVHDSSRAEELTVGEAAPDFVATAEDGSQVRLSDYQGQTVVLAFSRAHW